MTFNATQVHAVVNIGETVLAIAGEVWRKDQTHQLRIELELTRKLETNSASGIFFTAFLFFMLPG
jgi:hypothetical protein